jgi:tripartite-type tricarboxylate transporter receptor subunit TctC
MSLAGFHADRSERADSADRARRVASTGHLSGELLRSLTGIDIGQVPYKGGSEGIAALLSGEIELASLYVS